MEQEFLITKLNYAPSAYLILNEKSEFCVFVDGEPVTDCFLLPELALEQYMWKDPEFVVDFLHGVQLGDCSFGENYYGQWCQNLFTKLVAGRVE